MKSNPRLNLEPILSERTLRLLNDAQLLLRSGKLTSCRMTINKVLRNEPNNTDALMIAYQVEAAEGVFDVVLNQLTELVNEHDLSERQMHTLAGHLNKLELYFLLSKVLDKLIVLNPLNDKMKYQQSLCLSKIGQIEKSLELALQCEKNNLNEPLLYLNIGHSYKAFGNTEKAAEYYQKYIDYCPENSGYGYWGLADLKNYKFATCDIKNMENKLAKIAQGKVENKPELIQLALSNAKAQQKEYSLALQYSSAANAKLAQLRPFKKQAYFQLIEELHHYKPANIDTELQSERDITPIFIVGMPRSGTTLTEQILASHSQVTATDELPFIERIAMQLGRKQGYSKGLLAMTEDQHSRFKQFYLQQASAYLYQETSFIIDKNPTNYMHIGLILKLFPTAKIINLIRDPFDNAMSVYNQHFSQGNDFSYELNSIQSYMAGYLKIMQHWTSVFSESIHHLHYDQLVSDPKFKTTQLIEFCGLPIESQCYEFFKSDKPVLTPSASQVRQPIHNKSIGSANVYAELLPEFKQQMDSLKTLIQASFK